jgi:hypothetical protein
MKRLFSIATIVILIFGAMSPGYGADQLFELEVGLGDGILLQNGDAVTRLDNGSLKLISKDIKMSKEFPIEAKIYRDSERNILIVSGGKTLRLGKYMKYVIIGDPSAKPKSEVLENLEKDYRPKPQPYEEIDPLRDTFQ